MKLSFLKQTALFRGIEDEALETLLGCLNAREKHYDKGSTICRAGDTTHEIGLVESGSVNSIVNFYWGDSHIFDHMETGEIFGETYAALPGRELLADVVAAEDCTIVFFDMDKLLHTCESACSCHNQIIRNLMQISAAKNLGLSERMMHTASRSIRERLLSYLSQQAQEKGSASFAIPFSRQQLADYLGVDRSALSNELSKMGRDGLIRYHKNEFTLL